MRCRLLAHEQGGHRPVGLVQFDTFVPAIILLAALNAINFVVANIVLPRMQGESLNLDPVVVLFSLALWTVIWGLPGAFLSTPLTVTLEGQVGSLADEKNNDPVRPLDVFGIASETIDPSRTTVNLKAITHPGVLPPITLMNWLVLLEERRKEYY